MFRNTFQNGLLSIFYSCGSNPLAIWDMHVKNGHIKRITDVEVNSMVLEIVSTNVATTFITCPNQNSVLGIKLPFLVMIVKNLKRYFSFEITILDDKNMRRRFRISNFQSSTKIKPFCTSMPISLSSGWNQIQFNLSDFTKRAYGSQFMETLRVQVNANVRLRRIYFSDRLYTEDELPQDYKLYLPLDRKQKKVDQVKKMKETKETVTLMPPPPPPAEGLITEVMEVPKKVSQVTLVSTVPEEKSEPADTIETFEAATEDAEKVGEEGDAPNEVALEQEEGTDKVLAEEGEPVAEEIPTEPAAELLAEEAPALETVTE